MALLNGEELDYEIDYAGEYGIEQVAEWDNGLRVLVALPEQLLQLLQNLPQSEMPAIADQWALSPEIQCYGHELEPVLHDLQRLAGRALAEDKQLYLHNLF